MKFVVILLYISLGVEGTIPKALRHYKTATASVSFPMCANCSVIPNHQTNVGYSCHFEDDLAVEENYKKLKNEHPKCLPNEFIVTRDIRKYCCFWSPMLGCSALIGRQLYEKRHNFCKTCGKFCSESKRHLYSDTDGNEKVSAYGLLNALALFVLWRCL